ncbi:MAG: DUF4340 domain-containing protein [Clostridia bacterium]|nr:DUF4340 domain-containing protein [Clostridia bacterium]
MNKQIRNILIILAVLAAAAGIYLIARSLSNGSDGSETSAPSEEYTLPPVDQTKLTEISITVRKIGESAEIRKLGFVLKEDMTGWEWTDDKSVPLDNQVFADIVLAVSGKASDYRITEVAEESLPKYGLDTPFIEASFGYSDGSAYNCKIGSFNAFSDSYYFMDGKDPSVVYTISSADAEVLDKTIADFVLSEKAPEITSSGITSVSVEKDGHKTVYSYNPQGVAGYYTDEYKWSLSADGAEPFPISSDVGNRIVSAITSAGFSECVAFRADTDLSAYGLDKPVKMTVAYTYTEKVSDSTSGQSQDVRKNGEWVLLFGSADENGELYVKTESSALVYLMEDSALYSMLIDADALALRPAELVVINPDKLDGVSFSASGKTLRVLYEKSDAKVVFKDADGAELKYNL